MGIIPNDLNMFDMRHAPTFDSVNEVFKNVAGVLIGAKKQKGRVLGYCALYKNCRTKQ
jgi:hypothetical protein